MKNLITIILLLLLASCRKDSSIVKPQSPLPETSKATGIFKPVSNKPPYNPANPQDHFGAGQAGMLKQLRLFVALNDDATGKGADTFLYEHYGYGPGPAPFEQQLKQDYQQVWNRLGFSQEAKGLATALNEAIQSIEQQNEYDGFYGKVTAIETRIIKSLLPEREKNCLLLMASVIRHSAYELVGPGPMQDAIAMKGIGSWLRKVAAVICAIGAGATVAGWHYLINSPYDHMAAETTRWMYIVGYYVGWWPEG